jgi:PAS domain S-box-containing protein
MYLCTFKLFVMSANKSDAESLVQLLQTVKPPEDCVYQLEALAFGEPFVLGTDSAVIFDRDMEQLRQYRRHGSEHVVFLAPADAMAKIDTEALAVADDFWIMPDKQSNDVLLKVYFAKLLKVMKERSDARKAEICFRTVIDSLPDLVWFKDNDGAHLIVNNEFCGVVEKTKAQIYKQHHNYIWDVPEDDYKNGEAVCRQSEEVVVKARKTCQFEEKITTKDGMRQLVTYKSPLIDEDGTIFGTCGMGHDITDLQNVTKELRIVIDSIPFGVAIVDADGKILAINKFFQNFFPNSVDRIGHSFAEWSSTLPVEKLGASTEGEEYSMVMNDREHILRFREEPIADIFGENIGSIQFIR